jgi:hypothetical protein
MNNIPPPRTTVAISAILREGLAKISRGDILKNKKRKPKISRKTLP